MPRRVSSPTFVGRAAELERLMDGLARAIAGQPSLVLVGGEAGVGKTRLLGELGFRTEALGVTALIGACLDLGEGALPFAPFAEALRGWSRGLDPAARAALVGDAGHWLARIVPELGPVGASLEPELDPAGRQARLFDAILAVLGRLARDRPALLVLEDLHWADGSTRDLVRFLVRNLRDERLLIVGTYRSDDLHRRHPLMPLLSELERSDRVERINLQRFDRTELRAQLAGITGRAASEADIEAFLERSDGNPFYVEELVAGGRTAGPAMPATLREILDQRLGSLSGDATALVRAASVVGVRVPSDRLGALVDLDDQRTTDALRAAVDAGILVPANSAHGPGFAFRHALLREAAYDDLLPTEQVRLHARLADYLARQLATGIDDPAVVGDFAVHAYHAGDQAKALEGSVRAMRRLDLSGAFQEALGHGERALELWPRVAHAARVADIDYVGLLSTAARLAGNISRPERAVELGQLAFRELAPSAAPEQVAGLLVELWTAAFEAWDPDVMAATAAQMAGVADRLGNSRLKAQLLNLYGYGWGFQTESRASIAAHEQALAIARSIHDNRMVAMVAPILARQLTIMNRAGRSPALLAASGLPADYYDSTAMPFWATIERHMTLWWLGRYDEAIAVNEAAVPMALRYGQDRRVLPWFVPTDPLFELGQFDEAVELEARSTTSVGDHVAMGQRRIATQVAVIRGDLEEARSLIGQRVDRTAYYRMGTLRLRALVARAAGDLDALRGAIGESLRLAAAGEVEGLLWLVLPDAVGGTADAAERARRRRRTDDLERALADGRQWMQRLRIVADAAAESGPDGAGAFCDAALASAEAESTRLEDHPDPAAWSLAVERWMEIRHAYGTAYARLRLAEATLKAGGDRTVAETVLRQASGAATALGAAPLLVEINAVARRARIDLQAEQPTRPALEAAPSAGHVVLTGRERDVLSLVAEGHTNREIGDRLFISEKTASVHVSNAMAKLGALSRYEAAATAERLGLLV